MRTSRHGARKTPRRRPTAAFREAVRAEYFASRLFDRRFVRRISAASGPILPAALEGEREDVVEQALLRAYDHRGLYHGETDDDLQRWVLRMVSNVARDASRERARRAPRAGRSRRARGLSRN